MKSSHLAAVVVVAASAVVKVVNTPKLRLFGSGAGTVVEHKPCDHMVIGFNTSTRSRLVI